MIELRKIMFQLQLQRTKSIVKIESRPWIRAILLLYHR
jgi:hypothetical protein